MRWVILSDDWVPGPGGVATWSWGAAAGLVAAGCDVQVFCRGRPGLRAPDGATITGIRPWSARFGPALLGVRAASALRLADAVLATTWSVAAVVAPVLASRGIPLHVVFHGSDATRSPRRPKSFQAVCRAATHRWAVSEFLVAELAERGVAARWIPTPIRSGPDGFDPKGPWLFVARATPLKGGDRFVRIVAAAGAEGVVLGGGTALSGWRQLAESIGARVSFPGPVDRTMVGACLERAALVALLPRPDADGTGAEGLGLTLLEARSRGVLPVGCRTGGVPEAVGPGLILDDPDNAEASARSIQDALHRWVPDAGRRGLERHGPDRVAAALLA